MWQQHADKFPRIEGEVFSYVIECLLAIKRGVVGKIRAVSCGDFGCLLSVHVVFLHCSCAHTLRGSNSGWESGLCKCNLWENEALMVSMCICGNPSLFTLH